MSGSEQSRNHPALTDAQTGLANELHFGLVYDYLFEAGDRGLPFTIMLVSAGCAEDASGDVRDVGQAIERTTRTSDLVAHVGSGRFAVLLIGTNLQGARIAADRIEMALESLAPGAVCFGLAAYRDGFETSRVLMNDAEAALTAAESTGGGVEFAWTGVAS